MSERCVYVIVTPDGYSKIGVASAPASRIASLQVGNHLDLSVVLSPIVEEGGHVNAIDFERRVHDELAQYRVRGEWFYAPLPLIADTIDRMWVEMRYPQLIARWRRRFGHDLQVPSPSRRERDRRARLKQKPRQQ